jgi:hypothetical protein
LKIVRRVVLASIDKNISDSIGLFCPAERTDSAVAEVVTQLRRINTPLFLVKSAGETRIHAGLSIAAATQPAETPFSGLVSPCPLESLGNPQFCHDYGIRYPYLGGSMAKGISSVEMVEALGRAGMLGFFGAAGLSLEVVEVVI